VVTHNYTIFFVRSPKVGFCYETFDRFEKKFGRRLGFFQMPIGNLGIFARLGKYRLPVLYKEGGKSLGVRDSG